MTTISTFEDLCNEAKEMFGLDTGYEYFYRGRPMAESMYLDVELWIRRQTQKLNSRLLDCEDFKALLHVAIHTMRDRMPFNVWFMVRNHPGHWKFTRWVIEVQAGLDLNCCTLFTLAIIRDRVYVPDERPLHEQQRLGRRPLSHLDVQRWLQDGIESPGGETCSS